MNQRSKNHHIVPLVLQKHFAIEPWRIWYSEKDKNGSFGAPRVRSIEKAFRIRNHYTVHIDDKPSDIVEREFYGKIDDYLGKLLPDVLSAFDRGEVPTFSGAPLHDLQWVVFEMAKRTPDFIKDHDDTAVAREIVESTLTALPKHSRDKDRARLRSLLDDPLRIQEFGRTARVQGTIRRSKNIESALEGFSVRWAVSETHHSYILSSMMAYRIGNGGPNGLSNPNMEIWMPISPKVALVLVRDPKNQIPIKIVDNALHIREVNKYAMRNSERIASHSKKLIESLTGKRAYSS